MSNKQPSTDALRKARLDDYEAIPRDDADALRRAFIQRQNYINDLEYALLSISRVSVDKTLSLDDVSNSISSIICDVLGEPYFFASKIEEGIDFTDEEVDNFVNLIIENQTPKR